MQIMYDDEQAFAPLFLPEPETEVLPGVRWGHINDIRSVAFWASRAWLNRDAERFLPRRSGVTLWEETAACLLGGYGMPAEVGVAAFGRVRSLGLLGRMTSEEEFLKALCAPFAIGKRSVRYRFAHQKARYLFLAQMCFSEIDPDAEGRRLRDSLLNLPGVGPKTASWIVRNWCGADDVAIIDVHIYRACVEAGIFDSSMRPDRDYFELEQQFIDFANAVQARASVLDNLIWSIKRAAGSSRAG